MAIAMLAEAFGVKDLTPIRVKVYEQALQKVPTNLLDRMVRKAIETRTFFPRVAELLADAEVCRRELLAAHPYERCASCHHMGTVRIGTTGGRPQYGRCKCWTAYQERLSGLGVTEKPIAQLTAGEPTPEEAGAALSVEDVSPDISDKVRAVAASRTW